MNLTISAYWPLLLLAALPYLWRVRRGSLSDLNADQLKVCTIARMALVGALVLALIQPVWTRSTEALSVAYLLDVSHSVSPQAIAASVEWIERADADGSPDHAVYIPFGANAHVLGSLDLDAIQVTDREAPGAIDQSGTNLERALRLAARSFAPRHIKRVVLLSDGLENEGHVETAARLMRSEGIRVFTRGMESRSNSDTWVEGVLTPETVTAEEPFPVDVHVFSQVPARGLVLLQNDGTILGEREVDLDEGLNRVAFETRLPEAGSTTLEVEIRLATDAFPDNNIFRKSVQVRGRPRVMYIEGRPESSRYLVAVLEREGIEIDVVEPADIPSGVSDFDDYELVILSDVAADALTMSQMEALETYARDLGGGFILAGGDAVYGEEGYSETTIEEMLPVRFDLEREPPTVALIIVLDKSGSMGGQKLDLVKEASKAAVEVLEDDHLIGLVAFDYNHYWPVELQPAENREAIDQSISTIVAGGETNIFPALEAAHERLTQVEADVEHVILLSDGRSLPDDFQTLVERMNEAMETVSTVAVGNGADRELLSSIANWGNGRDYFIQDAARVPQIFTEETELATQGTLLEEPFRPVVMKDVEALKGIDFAAGPPLLGYVRTIAKDNAEILLESPEEEPILARWQYGLGKSVAFTADVKDRWASEWLNWEGYAKFWPQLVRETMRRNEDEGITIRTAKEGKTAHITITAFEEDGGFRNDLATEVRMVDPAERVSAIDIHQSGPGTYEAHATIPERGAYVFRFSGDDTGAAVTIPYSYPDEYRFHAPETALLEELSRLTGGTFEASTDIVFDIGDERVTTQVHLWPYFASLALLLYLGDLLLRRMRLFEP